MNDTPKLPPMADGTADPILKALLNTLPPDWRGDQLVVGDNWTMAVILDPGGERHAGLAATPHNKTVAGPVNISGADAIELAHNVYSDDPTSASIGFATLNAFLEPPPHLLDDIDAADWLAAHGRGRRIALVGRFPFVEELRAVAAQVWVLELSPQPGEFPASEAATIIPAADIVAITASTLINHTLGGLLALTRRGAAVMLLGPTTPLTPILFKYGLHVLSGVRVVDIDTVLASVTQGLIFRHISGLRRVTLSAAMQNVNSD